MWVAWATKGASIGALVLQILEFFSQITEEVEYLWRIQSRGRIRLITYLYAWSRYFPLFAQIANLFLSELALHSPTPRQCMITIIYKAITAQLATICIETILAIRGWYRCSRFSDILHALYNCSRRTGIFLITVSVIGTICEITGTSLTIRILKSDSGDEICNPAQCSATSLALFAFGCGLIQSVLLCMTLTKIILGRKLGLLRTPLVTLMLRDGLAVFLMLVGKRTSHLFMISTIFSFETVRSQGVLLWNMAFAWYLALVSVSGCRLILNIRRLAVTHSRNHAAQTEADLDVEFTDIIEFDSYFSSRTSSMSPNNSRMNSFEFEPR
ncbi:hypothetical protein B0H34DRAFT_668672 [Crassisporium funariophilum]|nr:hypothetical protein B0H34DRAFT_668672 [Crassisporium funariophilum]